MEVVNKIIKKTINKLKSKSGSGYMYAVALVMFIIMLISFAMEYMRVQVITSGIHDAYENATLTVVSENYNEVYAGFREIEALGGEFEGGAGGGGDVDAVPEWVSINDYGDIYIKLMELLDLEDISGDEERLTKVDDSGGTQYELYDFNLEVKDAVYSSVGKYEIRGYVMLNVPIYFAGAKVSEMDMRVKISGAYSAKY